MTYDGYAWRRTKNIATASAVHAQISRDSLLWSKIEPEQGIYDWAIPDAVVSDLGAKGIEPLFVAWGSPSWANGVPSTTPGAEDYVPTDPAAFAQWLDEYVTFIKAAVARYQGRVEKWEIWNEENEHFTWKPAPNVTEYAVFFQAIRSAILSVDPQAQVAIGGLTGLSCSSDIPGLTFLKTLIDMKLPFDYVAIHPYSGKGQSPEVHISWQNNFDDIAAVRNLLVAAGRPVPLWVTEWGWSSAQVGADVQAQYLGQSLELLKTQYPYVTVATYFLDVDRDTTYQQGLFDADYNPKPAAAVFAGFINSLGGSPAETPSTSSPPAVGSASNPSPFSGIGTEPDTPSAPSISSQHPRTPSGSPSGAASTVSSSKTAKVNPRKKSGPSIRVRARTRVRVAQHKLPSRFRNSPRRQRPLHHTNASTSVRGARRTRGNGVKLRG